METNNRSRGMRNNHPLTTLPAATTPEGSERLSRLILAMTCVECGLQPEQVSLEPIAAGYRLAFYRTLQG